MILTKRGEHAKEMMAVAVKHAKGWEFFCYEPNGRMNTWIFS